MFKSKIKTIIRSNEQLSQVQKLHYPHVGNFISAVNKMHNTTAFKTA